MRRRDKVTKTQRPKTLKGRNAPKAARRRSSLAAGKQTNVALLTRERDEALEQQAAMAEILGVISNSPTDLAPVFNAILANATRLCEGNLAALWRYDGKFLIGAAQYNASAAFIDKYMDMKMEPGRAGPARLAALERRTVHIADITAEPGFAPLVLQYERARSVLAVPLLRQKDLVGIIAIWRREVRPFTDKQIELVKNFAAQAVIAIENTRLLNELRQRTNDLSESLEQQTATSEVLKVISSSPGELKPVFDALLANAVRICDAKFGVLFLSEGDAFRYVALHGAPPAFAEARRREPVTRVKPGTTIGRVAATKKPAQTADIRAEPAYTSDPERIPILELAGARTILGVPMLKESQLVGAIVIYRQEVRPFTDKQIDLLSNFAAQAVIAIENARLLNELRQRTDDLSESLEQQTATTGVLKTISSSPGELEPVFDAILENAVRICGAKFGSLVLFEGNAYRRVALHNGPPAYVEARARDPVRPLAASPTLSRVAATKRVVQVADMAAEQPEEGIVRLGGARTVLAVPMLNDDRVVGVISIYRQEVRPFTDKQTELVKNFAAQAVIAIENARLLNELHQRTDDLSEALDQQTATSEVLEVISSSPGELQPIFNTMLAKASELCEASYGLMWLSEGDAFRTAALLGDLPQAYVDLWRSGTLFRPGPHVLLSRVAISGQPLQVADLRTDASYLSGDPLPVAAADIAGVRTLLVVPMVRDKQVVGAIGIYRKEIKPFADKQIELVTNFAAQSVIAIENARLLSELRESLQQQTATADVLKVISGSAFDLKVVLETLIESATRLCGATRGHILQFNGEFLILAAAHGAWPGFTEFLEANPFRPGPGSVAGRAAAERRTVHVHDVLQEPGYIHTDLVKRQGYHTVLAVPMLREETLLGVIVILKTNVEPFTDKQVDLVETFADQAVIAIENARLLNELRESLQQQTATADVLKVISRSAFDLKTVLDTLLRSAARLCEADQGTITQRKGDQFYRAVAFGYPQEFMDYVKDIPVELKRDTGTGRALLESKVIHIHDVEADPEYTWKVAQQLGGFHTLLGVPMLREGEAIGVLTLTRKAVRPFTDKQIELVTTFADQAAIAIENVRLFDSVEARTRELAASLEDLRSTQDRLVQTQKLASLGQLTAGIAHEIKNPLNFVNNFSGVSAELIDELQEALKDVSLNEKRRGEITELMDTLRGNLDKVIQHGKRADAIVKNMLLHSREGSGEHRFVDINAVVEESLNLAYHGARAEKQGFNITLERSLDPTAGEVDVFPQEITRVLLNLISNGFYAATKRKAGGNGGDYEPTLTAMTKNLGDRVEIRIRDNGIGIPPEVKEKMFNPFFTTKPAGEGTGLGLSISHDIVVKQHGGSIEVDTQPGEFSEFRIILPRAAVFLAESGGRV